MRCVGQRARGKTVVTDENYGAGAWRGPNGRMKLTSVTLEEMVSMFWLVDHIDLDCQGCENFIFTPAISNLINQRVKSIWIECHGLDIGANLEKIFLSWGWHFALKISPVASDFGQGPVVSENGSTIDLWVLNPKFHKPFVATKKPQ